MGEFPTFDRETDLQGAVSSLKSAGILWAHVGIVDFMGTFRERRLAVDDVVHVMDGGGTFVNVIPQWDASENVFGSGPFLGESVAIDIGSIRPYPFEPHTCLMIADYTGVSAALSPRQLLQTQIDKAASLGLDVCAAFETEFIVLEEHAESLRQSDFSSLSTFAKDNRCWAGESAATHAEFIAQLGETLKLGDIDLLSLGLELGPGCFEATIRAGSPMRAADNLQMLKLFSKAFCRQRGLTASFMAQLSAGFPGLSQHPHVSLVDKSSGKNIFNSDNDASTVSAIEMSESFGHFVAGMISLIPEAMALTHHTTNSYRRLAPGNWAPKSASWALQNYSSAIRIITTPASHCRLEYRLPGADANPYLNLSFILGAGLWGMENKIELPAEFTGGGPDQGPADGVALPHDLFVSAKALETSEHAKAIWGTDFISHFVAALRAEEAALRRETSNAERARYLEVV